MSKSVPCLDDEAIERDAAALLAEYAHVRGVTIEPPIPIDDIVEKHLNIGTTPISFSACRVQDSIPTSSGRCSSTRLGSKSTKASIPMRARPRKAGIVSRSRASVAGIGGCIATCSLKTRHKRICSAGRPHHPSSVVRRREDRP
jgi:hypothetical protein